MQLQGQFFGNTVSDTKAEMLEALMPLQGHFLEDNGRLRQCHGDSFYLDLVVFKAVSWGQLLPGLGGFQGQFFEV